VELTCRRALLALTLLAGACGRTTTPTPETKDPETLSVTRWTGATELFAEYPALVAGRTSRFAIHLTRLDTFKALRDGQVEVRLTGGGTEEVFRTDGPSRPGIFGVDVKPAQSGKRSLVIVLRATGLEDTHRIDDVVVHASVEAALSAPPQPESDAPGISFLKEQQWSLDFGTAVVQNASVRESVRVPARFETRPGGTADVVAPINGRLTRVPDLSVGAPVTRGQELGLVLPPPAVPGDLPQLERARAEAQTTYALAVRDRERAERLTAAGAAPQKRLDEARTAEEHARARVSATEASLKLYHAARSGGDAGTEGLFVLRAPITGAIADRQATAGANVAAGALLFRIVDAGQIHVVGRIPEAEVARTRRATAAEIELPGRPERLPAGRMTSAAKVLDPHSRTLPVTFTFDNRQTAFPIGQSVFLHLLLDPSPPRPALPVSAIVDDAGRPIVFVQREGETFERRAVTLGPRSGGVVQIVEGVKAGERVVTKGAFLVRLASLSTSVPAHGHVH
jgi:RND family efflux transporter MFP subunit